MIVLDSVTHSEQPVAAYVHVPFCVSKCSYCDFNSFAGMEDRYDAYASAVCSDIAAATIKRPLNSIYIGGGTPTCIGASRLGLIIKSLHSPIQSSISDCEITIEANPGTLTEQMLKELACLGLNRVSLGVQSFNDICLNVLGRSHDANQAFKALQMIRNSGIKSRSIDLMYGLPGQTLDDWVEDVNTAVREGVQHISAYELTIEEGTPIEVSIKKGELHLPDEDLLIEMQQAVQSILQEAGIRRYEVSNYALPGHECRHNLAYWNNESYFGFGAGAVGYQGNVRYTLVSDPNEYISRAEGLQNAVQTYCKTTTEIMEFETLMMGLRLVEGIKMSKINKMGDFVRTKIRERINNNLLHIENENLKATPKGFLLLGDVLEAFLP